MTHLGYMARDQYGQTVHLPGAKHPRKALLAKVGARRAERMYVDGPDGKPKHNGYIVGGLKGRWFTLYAVQEWTGKGTS